MGDLPAIPAVVDLRETLQSSFGTTFTVERELGGGGMSRVFLAEETRFGRRVVIKVLSPELTAGLSVQRFEREITLAAQLQHANVVPVITAGEVDGLPWYSMPYVEGESLRARLERSRVPSEDAVSILRDVARALAYAHVHGIVHRDIKPENVLLSGGAAVVTDFGIAKALSAAKTKAPGGTLTQIGTSLGTPAYMAPEQAMGDEVDARADLYSWGVMAYELLAGAHPFGGKRTAQQLVTAHLAEAPRPLRVVAPNVPEAIAALVMRTLEKEPGARPTSADAVIQVLGGIAATGEGAPASRPVVSRPRRILVGVVALVVVTAAAAIAMQSRGNGRSTSTNAPHIISTLAVLPFVNTGGDPKDEYFSDGMTDELAHALAALRGLRLAGRTSSYAFKGKSPSAAEIGKALDVAGLIEGTVRRAGNRLRVTAQLTSTADGKVRWSDQYERPAGDVFAVQDELTKAIVGALAPALRGERAASVAEASRGTADPEAYDLYLRGHHFWAMRGPDNLLRAVDYFTRAAAKDPTFARAHAGLAMTFSILPGYVADPADTLTLRAIASGERALALDSTLAEAHLGLSSGLSRRNRPLEAEPHMRAALALEPENATAHQWHGDDLLLLGRGEEAVAELRRAAALDPLSTVVHDNLSTALAGVRRFDEAIVAARRMMELDPTYVQVAAGVAYLFANMPDSAVAIMERMQRREPDSPGLRATLALAYAAAGRWDEVDRIRIALSRPGGDRTGGVETAIVALASGDRAPLLRLLQTPPGQRQWMYVYITLGCSPVLDPLMTEPSFVAMLDRQGIRRCPVTTPWPLKARPR